MTYATDPTPYQTMRENIVWYNTTDLDFDTILGQKVKDAYRALLKHSVSGRMRSGKQEMEAFNTACGEYPAADIGA